MDSKTRIIRNYYANYFDKIYYSGFGGKGSKYIHKQLEKVWHKKDFSKVLEVGAGICEHLEFVQPGESLKRINYFAVDQEIREMKFLASPNISLHRIQANVEKLPFNDNHFDRVVATCLFLHLDNPLSAYEELRRVTKVGGEISLAYPTDPGILNRFIKRVYTFRKARRLGANDIKLVSALEHQNHIHGLLSIQEFVFDQDLVKNKFLPFRFPSWNFNILVISHIKKY